MISYRIINIRERTAISTAIDVGTIFDKSRLNPISVIPKLLGEKNNMLEMIPTNAQLAMK